MQQLPKPTLGQITAITINSPSLNDSLAFYQQLGFEEVMRAEWPFPWIQVKDGVLLIMLRKDPTPYIALTYYVKNVDQVVATLRTNGIEPTEKPQKTDMIKRYLLRSPDNINISLVSMVDGFKQPAGQGMLQLQAADYADPTKYANKTIGMFGEFAQPVADLEKSIAYWRLLGFEAVSQFSSPYPWAIVTDGLAVVGLHQTSNFDYPVITYFAADMAERIARLKNAPLGTTMKGDGANVTLTTPEGQHINLFSMGMPVKSNRKKAIDLPRVELETDRLLLKEISPELLTELFTNGYEEGEIMDFLGHETKEDLEIERGKWKGGYATYRSSIKSFLIVVKDTGKAIGRAGYHNWFALHQRAEIGYALNKDIDKGKGYMGELLPHIIGFGFGEMGLNRIEAYVGSFNVPSLKLVTKNGFTKEGILKEHYNVNGKLEDSELFALLRSEYKS